MNEMSTSFAHTVSSESAIATAQSTHQRNAFFLIYYVLCIHQIEIFALSWFGVTTTATTTCQFCCDYHLFDLESSLGAEETAMRVESLGVANVR